MQTEEFMQVGDRMRSEVVPHSPSSSSPPSSKIVELMRVSGRDRMRGAGRTAVRERNVARGEERGGGLWRECRRSAQVG